MTSKEARLNIKKVILQQEASRNLKFLGDEKKDNLSCLCLSRRFLQMIKYDWHITDFKVAVCLDFRS